MRSGLDASQPAGRVSRPVQVLGWVSALAGMLSTGLILLVLVLTAINVVARYLVENPISGVDEATGFLVVAIVMLGATETYRRGDHIRIDILIEKVPAWLAWWLELLAHAGILAFAGVLAATAWHTVRFSYDFGAYSSGYLELPLWIPQSVLVVGSGLLSLMAIVRIGQHLRRHREQGKTGS